MMLVLGMERMPKIPSPLWSPAFLFDHVCLLHEIQMKQMKQVKQVKQMKQVKQTKQTELVSKNFPVKAGGWEEGRGTLASPSPMGKRRSFLLNLAPTGMLQRGPHSTPQG